MAERLRITLTLDREPDREVALELDPDEARQIQNLCGSFIAAVEKGTVK